MRRACDLLQSDLSHLHWSGGERNERRTYTVHGGRTLNSGLLRGPVLIVAPLSTVPNWTAELRLWCPSLNCVTYIGNAEARQTAREYEFPKAGKGSGGERCKSGSHLDVLLTSYEVAMVVGNRPFIHPRPAHLSGCVCLTLVCFMCRRQRLTVCIP